MGYGEYGGMGGLTPLSYTEIHNYMLSTKTELTPSEVNLIRKMSETYVGESNNDDPMANPPYYNEKELLNNDVSDKIKMAFSNF